MRFQIRKHIPSSLFAGELVARMLELISAFLFIFNASACRTG
jgi:hypothetical protein